MYPTQPKKRKKRLFIRRQSSSPERKPESDSMVETGETPRAVWHPPPWTLEAGDAISMPPGRPPLGAHVSIAGGLPNAIERGLDMACEAIQIFVKNNSRWLGKALMDEEVQAFRSARAESSIGPVIAHASYLINLAALDPVTLDRSLAALADELNRCHRLGLDGLVLHPGAHVGAGTEAGLDRVIASLDSVFGGLPASPPLPLEITAGQGTVLGSSVDELATIVDGVAHPDRLGVCLDTCHAFAAGYALDQPAGYEAFFDEIDSLLGLGTVGAIHLNDSVGSLASHRDRHANIGQGEIGTELFARLVGDSSLASIPMILETPRWDNGAGHRADLELLRRFRDG